MKPRYYDKDGSPITDVLAWAEKFEDRGYKRVAHTTLPDGKQVSTVWLGLDHGWGTGPPLIFETMVFPPDSWVECDGVRYSTLAGAEAGHVAMVEKWTKKEVSHEA